MMGTVPLVLTPFPLPLISAIVQEIAAGCRRAGVVSSPVVWERSTSDKKGVVSGEQLGYEFSPLSDSTKYIAGRLNVKETHSGCLGGIKEGLVEGSGQSEWECRRSGAQR
jgi:hypothetical protein